MAFRRRFLMPSSPSEFALELTPRARVDVFDVRREVSSRYGDALAPYSRALCCSFHTTAGYLDRSVASRLNQNPDGVMTEGVTHVQKRNELLAASDPRSAWMENQILEKYFAPVLDTPSYVSRRGHRWSPEQRQSVEAQAAGGNPGYVSRANPYPIYAWSRALFWLVSICIAGVIWIGASIVERSRRVG